MESTRACDRGSATSRHRRTVRRASSGHLSLLADIVAPPAHPISWQAICTELDVRWKDLRRSDNVRDVRGAGGFGGGGRMGLPIGRGGLGGGVGLLVILGLMFILGGPDAVMQLLSGGGGAPSSEQGRPLTAGDEVSDFVARVLGSTED